VDSDAGLRRPAPASAAGRFGLGLAAERRALIAVCGVLFLTFLDTTIVSVTLASVQSDLHAGVSSLQWVVNGYSLVFASLMLAAGSLGDRLGRKRVMLVGVAIFCAASVAAALAPTAAALIAARAAMGVGAAASEPGTLSVIRHLYPGASQRARAIGVWVATAGLALALGPVLGGLLVAAGSWRSVFWFNLALGVVLFAATLRYVRESADPLEVRVDAGGFVFGAAFLGCATFATIGGETDGYTSTGVLLLYCAAGLALVALLITESRVRTPMLDRQYLTRPVVGALFVGFAIYFGIFSIFFFTALYLQEVLGLSAARIAGTFSPMAVAVIGGSLIAGRWVAGSGARVPMTVGCLLAAGGITVTNYYITHDPRSAELPVALAAAGLGFGLTVVPATSAVLGRIPPQHSGMAASAVNTSRQVGAVLGVAVLGSVVNAHLTGDLGHRLTQLGIPPDFQSIVTAAIEKGAVPAGGAPGASATYGSIVDQVIGAAYRAFRDGLTTSLLLSAGLIVLAAAVAWATGGGTPPELAASADGTAG
jgi:EmrB/QacA subfamily drug resistance transporter